MHLRSSSLAQKPYDTRAGRAAHYRIVDHDHAFAADGRGYRIEFDLDLILARRLTGRNERAPDIFILDKSHSVRDARSLGIPDCRVYSGIGNADHDIGIDGMLVRKEASGAFPRLMNAHPFDKRIGARKVDILENAERLFRRRAVILYRADVLPVEHHYLSGLEIADEMRADGIKRTRFRRDDIASVVASAVAERAKSLLVAHRD